jgi:hypothetical protein
MSKQRTRRTARGIAVAIALCPLVLGAEPVTAPVPWGETTVYVDPSTGGLRLTEAQDVEQIASALRERFGLAGTTAPAERPDGTRALVVGPSLLRFATARIEPDGTVSRGCVAGADAAVRHALAAQVAAAVEPVPADR